MLLFSICCHVLAKKMRWISTFHKLPTKGTEIKNNINYYVGAKRKMDRNHIKCKCRWEHIQVNKNVIQSTETYPYIRKHPGFLCNNFRTRLLHSEKGNGTFYSFAFLFAITTVTLAGLIKWYVIYSYGFDS